MNVTSAQRDRAYGTLLATASGDALGSESSLDQTVSRWQGWSRTAKDVGMQTRAALGRLIPGASR